MFVCMTEWIILLCRWNSVSQLYFNKICTLKKEARHKDHIIMISFIWNIRVGKFIETGKGYIGQIDGDWYNSSVTNSA